MPRCRSSAASAVMSENAFRTLKEFVGLKFSCFTITPTSCPTSASRTAYDRSGDTGTYGRIRSRAAVIASRSTGQVDRWITSGIIRSLELNVNGAGAVVRHEHAPRPAAHLTILDVLLGRTAARIDADLVLFAAVRTGHRRAGVGRTVAQGEVVDRIVAVSSHQKEM